MQSGTNKLKAPVSAVIDDVAIPAFVAPGVPTLVTARQSRAGPGACHSRTPLPPLPSEEPSVESTRWRGLHLSPGGTLFGFLTR